MRKIRIHTYSFFALFTGLLLFSSAMAGDLYQVSGKLQEEAQWHTKARIIKMNLEKRKLLLAHQDIPGLMPAMTMPFSVGELTPHSTQMSRLRENDTIAIDFSKSQGDFNIHRLTLLKRSEVYKAAVLPEILWNHPLVDQHNHRVMLQHLRGRVLLVNFFYSYCPTVCPLQTASLVKLKNRLAKDKVDGVHFVSISLDPKRDTPARLLAFANKFSIFEQPDQINWFFLTGEDVTVRQVTNGFNAIAIKQSNGELEHWVGIYLVDQSGNVSATYHGDNFDPEEILRDIERLL